MSLSIAFDIYGTLIDINKINSLLIDLIGDRATEFSQKWRDKQLEYSFRRGLMKKYENFSVCTSDALEFTCSYYEIKITKEDKNILLNEYSTLPAFNDVDLGLKSMKKSGHRLFAFSNGTEAAVEKLLQSANIIHYFEGIISTDAVKSYKPDPVVYHYLLGSIKSQLSDTWLISSNSFDVIGAISSGINSVWIQRSEETIFDPWEIQPTLIINNLLELNDQITKY